jgi:hypothetical protein
MSPGWCRGQGNQVASNWLNWGNIHKKPWSFATRYLWYLGIRMYRVSCKENSNILKHPQTKSRMVPVDRLAGSTLSSATIVPLLTTSFHYWRNQKKIHKISMLWLLLYDQELRMKPSDPAVRPRISPESRETHRRRSLTVKNGRGQIRSNLGSVGSNLSKIS